MISLRSYRIDSMFGPIRLFWSDEGLLEAVKISDDSNLPVCDWLPVPWLDWLARFRQYLELGVPFGAIPWGQMGSAQWTEFQRKVYVAASLIPHGQTRSYRWVAERAGCPNASRAVGQALGKNPVPLIVPCHRVIASDGALQGFMGKKSVDSQELSLKKALIDHEENYQNPVFPFLVTKPTPFTDPNARIQTGTY